MGCQCHEHNELVSRPEIDELLPGDPEAARRACAAHARCATSLYGGLEIGCDQQLSVLFNPFVSDSEWNLGCGLDQRGLDWAQALEQFRHELESRDRRLAVLLDSRHPEDLERFPEDSWEVAFRFSGLIYPWSRPTPEATFPASVEVLDVPASATPADEIADVFEAAFTTAVPEGLDPGYRAAIRAGIERSPSTSDDCQPQQHTTLVRVGGEPAAIGVRVQVGRVAGLYNLGVAPRFRGHKLGGAITEFRVAQARAEGAEVVFLLTEDPRVEASQIRRGFVPAFEIVGLVEASASR